MKKLLIVLVVALFAAVAAIMPLTAQVARKGLETPEKPCAEKAVYFAARTRMRLSRYQAAVPYLERALQVWPKSDRADEAVYWIAFSYERAGAPAQAARWYKAFMTQYPQHPWASQAKRRLDTLEAQNL
ncbi:MAG: tetratricopeptide repeat protein [Lentisphaerae bacterium]|nr:tetratricopeptide repeat protein [Lentisphaerota bacterium]